jgi:hypothetical protein
VGCPKFPPGFSRLSRKSISEMAPAVQSRRGTLKLET